MLPVFPSSPPSASRHPVSPALSSLPPSVLSLCSQVSRVQWPCFPFSCWIITWPPGSSASGTALSPWASPSVAPPLEACCSLSSGSLHQLHRFVEHWLHCDCFCMAAIFCDSEAILQGFIGEKTLKNVENVCESQRLHAVRAHIQIHSSMELTNTH